MTAPLTPPHRPPPDDPWQTQPAGRAPLAGADAEKGPQMNTELLKSELRAGELLRAALVTVCVAVPGLLLGLLWVWLAPRVPLISDGSAVFLKDSESEQAIGGDGTFLLLALAFGVVSALLVFLLRRRGGVALVLGLALGGLLGAVIAWRLGTWLGPTHDVVAHARAVGKNVTFDAPLELHAKGVLLAWPVAAMAVHLGLTALFGQRDPEPEQGWYDHLPHGPAQAPAGDPAPGGETTDDRPDH